MNGLQWTACLAKGFVNNQYTVIWLDSSMLASITEWTVSQDMNGITEGQLANFMSGQFLCQTIIKRWTCMTFLILRNIPRTLRNIPRHGTTLEMQIWWAILILRNTHGHCATYLGHCTTFLDIAKHWKCRLTHLLCGTGSSNDIMILIFAHFRSWNSPETIFYQILLLAAE